PQQAQLRRGAARPVVAGLQVAAQIQLEGAPAALVALLVGELPLAHGGTLLGGRLNEPLAALVVRPADAEGPPPAPHHPLAHAPPEADGCRGLVADGTGQLLVQQQAGAAAPGADGPAAWPGRLVQQQAGAAAPGADGPAAWPGDAGVAPAGDDHVTIPEQAGRPGAGPQLGRAVGAVQQPEAGVQGASHGGVSLTVV